MVECKCLTYLHKVSYSPVLSVVISSTRCLIFYHYMSYSLPLGVFTFYHQVSYSSNRCLTSYHQASLVECVLYSNTRCLQHSTILHSNNRVTYSPVLSVLNSGTRCLSFYHKVSYILQIGSNFLPPGLLVVECKFLTFYIQVSYMLTPSNRCLSLCYYVS
ncbi:hypothetical protein CI610_02943 [invertebrate metagenome]|uniref:Uncharacterized protein n=1 Tax=invertebrate metagenome TaxID=1711999 RepID=A0A2H9T4H2_9ZZZZ